jgi:hypothetical protein
MQVTRVAGRVLTTPMWSLRSPRRSGTAPHSVLQSGVKANRADAGD